MAKWFDCCGGHGRHLGNCAKAERSRGSGLLRNRVPGNRQARLLSSLKEGKQPKGQVPNTAETLKSLEDRGWVQRDEKSGKYKMTDAGEAALDQWEQN